MDSGNPPGVQMESRWNLWLRVKSSPSGAFHSFSGLFSFPLGGFSFLPSTFFHSWLWAIFHSPWGYFIPYPRLSSFLPSTFFIPALGFFHCPWGGIYFIVLKIARKSEIKRECFQGPLFISRNGNIIGYD
jgi:hypothetical protein